jgi:hypothetical protein
VKKYIEKYGKKLIKSCLRSKAKCFRSDVVDDKYYFCVKITKYKNGLRIFNFECGNEKIHKYVSVLVQKTGNTYRITDCGYSIARYFERTIAKNRSIMLSAVDIQNVPTNKLIESILECATKSHSLVMTGK